MSVNKIPFKTQRILLLYSFDALIPLINLDEKLHKFIFDDSHGIPKSYFIVQEILATIIVSIILPVLFITGL